MGHGQRGALSAQESAPRGEKVRSMRVAQAVHPFTDQGDSLVFSGRPVLIPHAEQQRQTCWESLNGNCLATVLLTIYHAGIETKGRAVFIASRRGFAENVRGGAYKAGRAYEDQRSSPMNGISVSAGDRLSLIHISEPTRLGMISYAVF